MMSLLNFNTKNNFQKSLTEALNKSQATIQFDMDGNIITANANFLTLIGYTLAEIQGRHHSLLVDPTYRDSAEYRAFWATLRRGQFQSGEFKRIGKGGREVWLEATYNPILDNAGKPVMVMKYATDVTARKMDYANLVGMVNAITRSQAVIEFKPDGTILTANPNFLTAMGYALAEIQGKPHSLFVEPAYRDSPDYRAFWDRLRRGEYQAGQFKRIGKGGREVWIEGSYNPVFDLDGKLIKVVKFATDITKQIALLTDLKRLIDVNFTEMEGAIHDSGGQADVANTAASETSGNVQMVAAGAEELAASIREISSSMAKSQMATDNAVQQVTAAGQATQRLAEAATAMTGIVALIQNIASQINLLALNATIEAARAGAAGKGFAVVAGEVKNLANQAAKATEQISQEIANTQTISDEVVSVLGTIDSSIDTVRDFVSATAAAVEEQSAVTKDMSATMQNASRAVETISGNISGISAAIHQAAAALSKTKQAAEVLAR
jgi:methyl-accepting chemotaxis protein